MVATRVIEKSRSQPVRVATFGDSNANTGSSVWDVSSLTAPFPASSATVLSQFSTNKAPLSLYYPRAKLMADCGISGQTTTQMLARDSAASSTTRKAITDVHKSRPDVIIYRGLSINDLMSVTSGNYVATADASFARVKTIIARLASQGALVIVEGIAGFDGAATDLTATRAALVYLNGLVEAWIASIQPNPSCSRVEYINPVTIGIGTASGAYAANCTGDLTHLSSFGGAVLGRAEAAILTRYFGRSIGPRFDGVNTYAAPMFDTVSTAGGYGSVASGISITATNATRQNAKIESLYGQAWQTCEFVPTTTGVSAQISMAFDPTTMGIVANDIFGFEFDWLVEGVTLAATPLLTAINSRVDIYKSGAGRVVVDTLGASSGSWAAMANGLVMGHASVPIQIVEPSANLTTSSLWRFSANTDDQVTFKLGVSNPRIVKLGVPQVTD